MSEATGRWAPYIDSQMTLKFRDIKDSELNNEDVKFAWAMKEYVEHLLFISGEQIDPSVWYRLKVDLRFSGAGHFCLDERSITMQKKP